MSLSRGRCHLAALEKNPSGFVLSVFSETSSRACGNPLSNSALTALPLGAAMVGSTWAESRRLLARVGKDHETEAAEGQARVLS